MAQHENIHKKLLLMAIGYWLLAVGRTVFSFRLSVKEVSTQPSDLLTGN
jgi:hypothetical protein